MPQEFSARDLDRWFAPQDRDDTNSSSALAATGLGVLAQRHGADARQRFLAAMFGPARSADFRGWLADVVPSRSSRFHRVTGLREKEFVAEWRATLSADAASQPSPK